MARISVDSSAVSHNKNGEGGGGVTYVMGGSSKSGSYNSLTVQSINAANGNIDYLKSKSISANDMSMIYISAVDGTIQKLKGSSANFDQGYFSALGADTIDANKLTVKDIDAINAWIETLQSREITTEYLTVTKQAHFFELIIDKIRSVGGQLIITPASCTADYVWGVDSNDNLVPANTPNVAAYEIYWRATQDDGRTVTNDWIVNDQAICQSFNNVHQETNYNISNKYYWRLVTQVSGITPDYDDIYVNLATGALTTDPNASEATLKNEFEVVMYKTTSILNNVAYDNNISWGCKAQELKDDEGHVIIPTNVKWDDVTLGENEVIHGIFKSASQEYGIQIDPTITENLPATTNFQLQIKQKGADDTYSIIPEKINIGVYFTDDTFLMWNDAPLDANGNFFFNMPDANSAIRSIIVTSTADVKWHLCHRIRVSNNPAEMDNVLSDSFAIPSIGDNLIQLGYQGNDDPKRQSAIIIAAYMTPDAELTCPSYAHYMGINDFHLSDHRHSYFDANGAKFLGDITFANVGNMTAKDKWMKLNVASTPIEIYEGESHSPSTRTISPSTYDLNITTVNDNTGNSETLTYVPSDYRLFIYYYDDNGKIDYGPEEVYSTESTEGSLLGLPAKLYVTVHNDNTDSDEIHFVKKIECVLVKGVNPANNIIDKVEIEYGYNEYWNTDSWCLIPLKEAAYATILDRFNTDAAGYSTNTVKLNVNFQYKAGHYKNGGMTNVLFDYDAITNPHGLRLAVHVYNQGVGGTGQGQENPPINEMTGQTYINDFEHNWVLSQDSTTYTFTTDNYLKNIYNQYPAYQDYINNYKNSNTRTLNPIMFRIDLVKNDVVLDSRTVYVAMQSGSIEKLTNDSYVRAISDSKQYTDQLTGPNGAITALQQDMTTIQQWATGISQTVDSNYNELSGDIGDVNDRIDGLTGPNGAITNVSETLHSEIEQTAGMIRTEVRRDYGNSAYHLNSSNSYWTMIDTDTDDFDADKYYLVNVSYQTVYERKYVYTFQVENESNEDFNLMLNVTYISASDGDWVGGNKYVNEYYLQNADIVIGDVAEDTDAYEMKFYVRGKHKYIFRCPETFYACGYLYDTDNHHIYPDPTQIHNSVTEPQNYRPTESSIEQTAERISLSVMELDGVSKEELKRTGIDITNGRIDLNAEKTVVHGNLNLTDTDNGMTVYDTDGIPSINMQPKPITQIAPIDEDKFTHVSFNLSQWAVTPFWEGESNGYILNNNSQIILQNTTVTLKNGVGTGPNSNTLNCRIHVYNSAQNDPFEHTIEVEFTKASAGVYILDHSHVIKIANQNDGETYYIGFYLDSFSNTDDNRTNFTSASFSANMYTGGYIQTYIGTDGFYVHTGINQLLKTDADKILLQMGSAGLRLQKTTDNVWSGRIDTICGQAGNNGLIKPNWVSFYNYIPMKQLNDGNWEPNAQIICTNGGNTEYKNAYFIDAESIYGDILIVSPKVDNNNNNLPLESWIVLPPDTWTDTSGYVHHLPVGFRVTIWNNFYRHISSSTVPITTFADIRVTPYRVNSNSMSTIVDANRNYNDYIALDTSLEQCVETFVYVGYETGSRPGSSMCWLAMHDVN